YHGRAFVVGSRIRLPRRRARATTSLRFLRTRTVTRVCCNPNNNNGWLEADEYLVGELGAMVDEQMVVPAIEEVVEPVAKAEDEQDDASDGFYMEKVWEVNEEWLMAPIIPPPMLAVPPPSVYEVSDVEVATGVTIGELGPRVYALRDRYSDSVPDGPCCRQIGAGLAGRCVAERHADPTAVDYSCRDGQPGEFTDAVYFGIG
ncbi:hypothetical protein Tco_1140233, partial [Tanacetum coccineum]